MKKSLAKSKLIVVVESNKMTRRLRTISVYDNRTDKFWTDEQVKERGITDFLDLADLKESLNWNLNGDEKKYRFSWGENDKNSSVGYAYVF
jgi:hypothetical protein